MVEMSRLVQFSHCRISLQEPERTDCAGVTSLLLITGTSLSVHIFTQVDTHNTHSMRMRQVVAASRSWREFPPNALQVRIVDGYSMDLRVYVCSPRLLDSFSTNSRGIVNMVLFRLFKCLTRCGCCELIWPSGKALRLVSRGTSVRIRFGSPFSSKVVVSGHCLVTLTFTIMKH